jgi:hypothetical protein
MATSLHRTSCCLPRASQALHGLGGDDWDWTDAGDAIGSVLGGTAQLISAINGNPVHPAGQTTLPPAPAPAEPPALKASMSPGLLLVGMGGIAILAFTMMKRRRGD